MGIRKTLVVTTAWVPLLAVGCPLTGPFGDTAFAQGAALGNVPGIIVHPGPSSPAVTAAGSAGAASPVSPATTASKARASAAGASGAGQIAVRDPVRREVAPKYRRSPKRPVRAAEAAVVPDAIQATGSASGAGGGAVTVSSAAAQAAGSVEPNRRTWPVVPRVGAGAAAVAQGTAAAGGSAQVVPIQAPPAQATVAQGAGAQPLPAQTAPLAPSTWSEVEIAQAKAHCSSVLRGVDAVMVPEDPIKQGECGSPVVYKLSSVGKGPAVELSPPVVLTCDMVATLDKWVKREVQPQARALLGGAVVKIETMSSYSCRNAYGRTKAKLSEHGKANAIDISSFVTAKEALTVLASWGPTEREMRAIAAKKEAERAAAQAGGRAPLNGLPQAVQPSGAASGASSIATTGVPGVVIPGANVTRVLPPPAFGLAPSRLGGPKAADGKSAGGAGAVPGLDTDPRRRFLREIHTSACKYFGTVLGPEANNAHKNHFHLDMAARPRGNFCE